MFHMFAKVCLKRIVGLGFRKECKKIVEGGSEFNKLKLTKIPDEHLVRPPSETVNGSCLQ